MSYEHLIAGTLGGLTSTLVLQPLDLLKVRFAVSDGQSSIKRNYRNISNAFATIAREEGVRGLYKGVAPNCLGAGASWGLYFLFYNAAKRHMLDASPNKKALDPVKHMLAGACAGVLTLTITNPIWVVKTRLYLQYGTQPTTASLPETTPILKSAAAAAAATSATSEGPLKGSQSGVGTPANVSGSQQQQHHHHQAPKDIKQYNGTWDALKKLYKYEGVSGLYKGFVPGLLGVSHGAIQLAAYEEMKRFYLANNNLPADYPLGSLQYLSCAVLSKLMAASITYPYQVVRARLQDQHVCYTGVLDVIRRTWKYESYLGFYKGFSAYLLHVTPNVCIVFFVYETVTKAFK